MKIEQFTPSYNSDVREVPQDYFTDEPTNHPGRPVHPHFTLSEQSAKDLAVVLGEFLTRGASPDVTQEEKLAHYPVVEMRPPMRVNPDSPVRYTADVPWLVFQAYDGADSQGNHISWPDGRARNAAMLASFQEDADGNMPSGMHQHLVLDTILSHIAAEVPDDLLPYVPSDNPPVHDDRPIQTISDKVPADPTTEKAKEAARDQEEKRALQAKAKGVK